MIVDVKVPEVGESITEGVLVQWFEEEGAHVKAGEPLFELETDKITMEVPAEKSGILRILVGAEETVRVGQVVANIDTEAAAAEEEAPAVQPAPAEAPRGDGPPITPPAGIEQAQAKVRTMTGDEPFSPAVRRMVEEYKLDAARIEGTGKGGRVTKEDVVRYVRESSNTGAQQCPLKADKGPARPEELPAGTDPVTTSTPPAKPRVRQTRRHLSPLRRRIAERLVAAQQTAAILTTFNEADMTNVLAWREKHKAAFKEHYDVSLGFMSFFVKASVDALKAVPQLNAQIHGEEIVENHFYDIGVAIGSERGLVVPVVRDADKLGFAEIELAIAALSRKVRDKTITLNELTGGVFTISNGGVFGSLVSTPILNPPQSGILGMHAIKKRPIAVGDEIEIRPMMYLAVSYDHRIVDGREAVTFLKRIVECIEDPERMMLEV